MLNDAIKNARKQLGMTQMDLIRVIEEKYGISISSSMISRYENPQNKLPNRISLPALFALTDYLNLDLTQIAIEEMASFKA